MALERKLENSRVTIKEQELKKEELRITLKKRIVTLTDHDFVISKAYED